MLTLAVTSLYGFGCFPNPLCHIWAGNRHFNFHGCWDNLALYNEMGIKEIGNKILSGISSSTLANIERINSNRYSYKLDFLIFAASLKYNGLFEQSRLERIERYINDREHQYIIDYLPKIYAQCSTKGRLAITNYIDSDASTFSGGLGKFLDTVYSNEPKDMVYYGFISKALNDIFDKSRRKPYV
jgi:transcriptional regulator with XRE-family HTH domain